MTHEKYIQELQNKIEEKKQAKILYEKDRSFAQKEVDNLTEIIDNIDTDIDELEKEIIDLETKQIQQELEDDNYIAER